MTRIHLDQWYRIWMRYDLTGRTVEHLSMFVTALVIAVLIGLTLAILTYQKEKTGKLMLMCLNTLETFPDLALLTLLIPLAGIGKLPTIIACILYSLLPITRNAWTGLRTIPSKQIEVGDALGLTDRHILVTIRLPLALPLIMGGIRIAVVFTMGIITLGGIIGAGGLGAPLQTGIFTFNLDLIVVVGLWVGFLAVILDGVAALVENRIKKRFNND